ncbi:hypothetical protein J2S09_000719 [Bacillus fengqiuensis]|nr:hypothetical protein [Bacillus fengqiuensis]
MEVLLYVGTYLVGISTILWLITHAFNLLFK